ncbi:MAG: biotin/lipoyl-binding protein [Halieaceae bacterium]|nr:biotin/lipoyl-binding protein [Halieaceae bacterium]
MKDDDHRWLVARLSVYILLFVLLMTWALFADIAIYERSQSAKLRAVLEPADVNAAASGLLANVHVTLGQQVKAGELLLTLDHSAVDASIDTTATAIQSLQRQRDLLEQQRELLVAEQVAELAAARRQVELQREQFADAANIFELQEDITRRFEQSTVNQLRSEVELLESRMDLERAVMELDRRDAQLRAAESTLNVLQQSHMRQTAEWERQLAIVDEALAERQIDLVRLRQKRLMHRVESPVA